jgi:uncharacterized protein YchJ
MPTQTYYRLWCKTCQDYIQHSIPFKVGAKMTCGTCQSIFEDTPLSEIPEEKVVEQRQRYKESKAKATSLSPFTRAMFGMGGGIDAMFRETPEVKIVEADAGQRELDEIEMKRLSEEYREAMKHKEFLRIERLRYKALGRNDICICGSEKKYKKCCLPRIEKYPI